MRVVLKKECENCGVSFETPWSTKRLCSRACVQQKFRRSNIRKLLLTRAKYRHNRKGFDFNLELEDIPQVPETCPVLGLPLTIEDGSGLHPNSVSLNRIDPSKGYIKGNIEIVSMRANHLLSNASVEELEKVLVYARRT